MTTSNKQTAFVLAFALAACLLPNVSKAADDDKPKPADNTAVNVRDRDKSEKTADQQKQNKGDVEITANIRKAVVKDTTLSTNAHNVKIITTDGMVTLKGPVKSDAEKATVEKFAKEVAGEKNVTNEIEIAP
jgi:hyperosmotically inducible protein